jgi:HEAT repeat protein
MAKPGRSLIATLTIALLVMLAGALFYWPAREPVYGGKPLSYWLVQLEDSDRQVERHQAALAIRHIGTNAIPVLLRMLRANESPLKTELLAWRRGWYNPFVIHFSSPADNFVRAQAGFDELGPDAAIAVPELTKILDENLSRECLRRTTIILGNLGPVAKAAVPSLLQMAVSTNTVEHYYEFDALGKIHANPDLVVPVLIQVMSHSHADRMYAVAAVGQFGGDAKPAVPALLALLNDPGVTTNTASPHGSGFISHHSQVERALQKIDPETYARVVTNTEPASTQ